MAGIKLGNTTVNKIYLGSTEIKAAYLGSVQVWGSSTPETQDSISLSRNSLTFVSLGGLEQVITVTASGSWTYTNATNWINCTVSGDMVTISCETNAGVNSRTGSISFSCGNATATLNVVQNSSVYITLSETSPLTFSPAGGTKTVTVSSSDNWTCIKGSSGEWIACDKMSGQNNDVVTITCQPNTNVYRSVTLEFICNSASTVLTIEQDSQST